jgi:hypothetical protein
MTELYWLPELPDWSDRLKSLTADHQVDAWPTLVQLARSKMDFIRTEKLARAASRICGNQPPTGLSAPPVRLALLGSSTVEHLVQGIRVAGLRRNLWIDVYTGAYGQYLQELNNPGSALYDFSPTAIIFAFDSRHLVYSASTASSESEIEDRLSATITQIRSAWGLALKTGAQVLQQTPLPIFPSLIGSNEHRHPWSPRHLVKLIDTKLRRAADEDGVDLVAVGEGLVHGTAQSRKSFLPWPPFMET